MNFNNKFTIPQSRKGKKPMSVQTLLRKEQEGTLYKRAQSALQKSLQNMDVPELPKGVYESNNNNNILLKRNDHRWAHSDTTKTAELETKEDAVQTLSRLKSHQNRSSGETLRGAGLGAVAGTLIGSLGRGIASGNAPKDRFRQTLADAATGAAYGGLLPTVRRHMELNVEKARLKDYIEDKKDNSSFSRTLARNIGI